MARPQTAGDWTLANQATKSFRQELNALIEALRSSNSGPLAPTTPVVGQLWADTTGDRLKVWNGTRWTAISGLSQSLISGGGDVTDTEFRALWPTVWPTSATWAMVTANPSTTQSTLSGATTGTLVLGTGRLPKRLAVLKRDEYVVISLGTRAVIGQISSVNTSVTGKVTLGLRRPEYVSPLNTTYNDFGTGTATVRFTLGLGALNLAATPLPIGALGITADGEVGTWTIARMRAAIIKQATQSIAGIVELASTDEAKAATNATNAMTPYQSWEAVKAWFG